MTDTEFEKLLGKTLNIPAIVAEAERARASEKALVEALEVTKHALLNVCCHDAETQTVRKQGLDAARAALALARGGK